MKIKISCTRRPTFTAHFLRCVVTGNVQYRAEFPIAFRSDVLENTENSRTHQGNVTGNSALYCTPGNFGFFPVFYSLASWLSMWLKTMKKEIANYLQIMYISAESAQRYV